MAMQASAFKRVIFSNECIDLRVDSLSATLWELEIVNMGVQVGDLYFLTHVTKSEPIKHE